MNEKDRSFKVSQRDSTFGLGLRRGCDFQDSMGGDLRHHRSAFAYGLCMFMDTPEADDSYSQRRLSVSYDVSRGCPVHGSPAVADLAVSSAVLGAGSQLGPSRSWKLSDWPLVYAHLGGNRLPGGGGHLWLDLVSD